ncbi:hypothetical protein Asi02nite_02800 [Asanoa siamensis]|uniref:Uncharacterized protein n=1 Tax=Asanoa siamensis TaxID=926357 RepID=A0ABQ4CIV4_9ACTN|nr:hypothetical protein Asi02nite_02800 [Asanoa siamensis]
MFGGLAAWALVLGGLGVVSHRTDAPTVREQRTLAEALPVIETALGHAMSQAGDDTVPVIPPVAIQEGCRITPMRSGATATGMVRFFTGAGDDGLLRRLAGGFPAAYAVEVSADGRSLRADAGEFVTVRGKLIAPGEVQVTATTGCRPHDVAIDDLYGGPTRAPERILTALGAASVDQEQFAVVGCPGGAKANTASASGRITATPARAGALDQGREVLATDKVYAYRRGADEAVAVVPGDGGAARVFVTKLC